MQFYVQTRSIVRAQNASETFLLGYEEQQRDMRSPKSPDK